MRQIPMLLMAVKPIVLDAKKTRGSFEGAIELMGIILRF